MREKLMGILGEIRPDVDFENEKALINDNVLESFDIIDLVSRLNQAFDIDISPKDLVAENFNSAEAMEAMIKRLQEEDD